MPAKNSLISLIVYDLSILSNIPSGVNHLFSSDAPPRLQTLFTIGVHDIPYLEGLGNDISQQPPIQSSGQDAYSEGKVRGWVACTTDSILASKRQLYDIAVHLPQGSEQGQKTFRPRLESALGANIKATQRDSRRYFALRRNLLDADVSRGVASTETFRNGSYKDNQHNGVVSNGLGQFRDDYSPIIDEELVEPLSWSELSYSSFMWWASAGEQQAELDSEMSMDEALLEGLNVTSRWTFPAVDLHDNEDTQEPADLSAGAMVMPLLAYFRRLTSTMLSTTAETIELAGYEEGESRGMQEQDGKTVILRSADLPRQGLDAWSASDIVFVEELMLLYFGKEAKVKRASVECCGFRIL